MYFSCFATKETKALEIISFVGTFLTEKGHLPLSVSDSTGAVYGGHMNNGCIVGTTAEVVIGELSNYSFSREVDESTGFKELVIEEK